jgi:hypothetical protein
MFFKQKGLAQIQVLNTDVCAETDLTMTGHKGFIRLYDAMPFQWLTGFRFLPRNLFTDTGWQAGLP